VPRLHRGGVVLFGVRALNLPVRLASATLAILVVALSLLVQAAGSPQPVLAQEAGPTTRLRLDLDCVARWDGDDVGGSLDLRVRGSGFTPGSQVVLRFAAQGALTMSQEALSNSLALDPAVATRVGQAVSEQPAIETIPVSDLGTFDTPLTVFWPVAEGTYLVTASTRGGGPTGTAILLVPCQPTLTLETDCNAQSDGASPGSVRMTGSGFGAGAVVEVSLSGPGVQRLLGTVVTDRDGAFELESTALDDLAGTYRLLADQPGSKQQAVAYLESPCSLARVEVQPDCAPAGSPPTRMPMSVEASGLHAGTTALVIFDARASHEVWLARVARDGTISMRIEPYRRAPGEYTLRITNEGNARPMRVATTSVTVPCEPRDVSISATPECARPALIGDDERSLSIEVSGIGFERGRVTVVFDADAIVAAQEFLTEADDEGAFSLTITPPAAPAGVYLIRATQSGVRSVQSVDVFPPLEATTTVRSPCRDREPPPLELEPNCGPAARGVEDAYELLVSGQDFYPASVVFITFGDGEGPVVEALAEAGGRFTTTFLTRGRREGTYRIRAVQRDILLQEVAVAEGIFTVPCAIDPEIAISPDYGPAGYTAHVTGTGFQPGTTMTLRWDRGINVDRPTSVTVADDGNFDVFVFILPNDFTGQRTLRAGLQGDPDAFSDVLADYVVVQGSGVPGTTDAGIVTRR
jgi:hypothetical protein